MIEILLKIPNCMSIKNKRNKTKLKRKRLGLDRSENVAGIKIRLGIREYAKP